MNMIPTHYTRHEGGEWLPWLGTLPVHEDDLKVIPEAKYRPVVNDFLLTRAGIPIAAFKFPNLDIWDTHDGWDRKEEQDERCGL